jgi:UDP-N-acetylmuramate--alanine ligase
MAAHILHQSHVDCNAFLGGITKNYGTNYILSHSSPYVVIEADEFDRSFHWLSPYASVITATDADHLDIYNTEEAYLESFQKYTTLIQPNGFLILHENLKMKASPQKGVTTYTYSREKGDFHAEKVKIGNGEISFDLVSPLGDIQGIQLGVPVAINIENGIAAMALAQISGVTSEEIKAAMASFQGVDRRFDFRIRSDKMVYLSDYAHHPEEVKRCAESLRGVFNGRKITAIFQPHLYTRTRDLYKDFARSLSVFDEVILTEIYPAREEPIPGVTSEIIYDNMRPDMEKQIIDSADILTFVEKHDFDVLVILGAGNLDDKVPQIAEILKHRM